MTYDKQGGVCFRTDDNHSIEKWSRLVEIFDRYDFKMTMALNLLKIRGQPDYVDFVRGLQARGHEIMDHTPCHRVFELQLATAADAARWCGRSGVDHVKGRSVYFEFRLSDPLRPVRRGHVRTQTDRLIAAPGESFAKWHTAPFIRLPASGQVLRIRQIDVPEGGSETVMHVTDFWGEPTVDLGTRDKVEYESIAKHDIGVSPDVLRAHARVTRDLAAEFKLEPPVTWIQPGGLEPVLWRHDIRRVYGDEFGYVAAAVYPGKALKCFNEFDPEGDSRFAMQWGDFTEDSRDLAWNKKRIADGIAKHYVLFGHSHLSGKPEIGGMHGYLRQTDALLAWCRQKGIPVRTYSQWATILYDTPQDPSVNVFPRLDVDLDGDGQPDGVGLAANVATTAAAPPGSDTSLAVVATGPVCRVERLAGLEKGANTFALWLKGEEGDMIDAVFTFPESREQLTFRATGPEWTKFSGQVAVPPGASYVDVTLTCNHHSGGTLRVGGITLSQAC